MNNNTEALKSFSDTVSDSIQNIDKVIISSCKAMETANEIPFEDGCNLAVKTKTKEAFELVSISQDYSFKLLGELHRLKHEIDGRLENERN